MWTSGLSSCSPRAISRFGDLGGWTLNHRLRACYAKGTANPAVRADTRQAELKAAVIDLISLPDEKYEIEGELICRYFDERSRGPVARFKSNKIMLGLEDKRTDSC